MSTKSKIITSILSLALVVVAVIFSINNILAASQQNARATFVVSYTAVDVEANVSATYYTKNGGSVALANGASTTLHLDRTTQTGSLSTTTLNLSTTNDWVVFEYYIQNAAPSVPITVTLADSSTKDNVTVTYGYSATKKNSLQEKYNAATSALSGLSSQTLGASSSIYCYILIKINSFSVNASYSSQEGAGLVWTLTSNVSA